MNLTADQFQQLKDRERDMLKAFVDICDKHGIKYFVQGGTLLGTVNPFSRDNLFAEPRT